MKTLVTIGSAISALFLGWHHYGVTESKNASESKSLGSANELETTNSDRQATNAGVAQGSASPSATPQPATKTNWVQERNSNWKSSLGRGAYDNHRAVTIAPPTVVYVPSSPNTTAAGFASPSSGSSGFRPPPAGMPPPRIRPSSDIRPSTGSVPPMSRPSLPPIPQRRPENLPPAPPPSPPKGS